MNKKELVLRLENFIDTFEIEQIQINDKLKALIESIKSLRHDILYGDKYKLK